MSAVLSDTPLPVRFKLTVEQYHRSAQTLTAGDTAVCQALPQISIGVDELFAGVC